MFEHCGEEEDQQWIIGQEDFWKLHRHCLLPIHRDQRCNILGFDRNARRRWDDVDRVLLQRLSDNSAIGGEHVNRLAALNADDGVGHHRDG